MKELQYHISSGLDKQTQQNRDDSREICNYQISQLKDICKSQQEASERVLKTKMQEQSLLRMQENEQLARQIEMITLKNMQSFHDMQLVNQNKTQNKNQDSVNVQKQVEEMMKKYNEEFAKLRDKIETEAVSSKNKQSVDSSNVNVCHNTEPSESHSDTAENRKYQGSQQSGFEYDRQSKILSERSNFQYNSNSQRNFTFVSPGNRGDMWNSKSVFPKPNPSPVAAVLPQPQNIDSCGLPVICANQSRKRGRKRKKTYGKPSRKSSRLNQKTTDTENDTTDLSQNSDVVNERNTLLRKVPSNYLQKPSSVYSKPQMSASAYQVGHQHEKEIDDGVKGSNFKVPQNFLFSNKTSNINSHSLPNKDSFSLRTIFLTLSKALIINTRL